MEEWNCSKIAVTIHSYTHPCFPRDFAAGQTEIFLFEVWGQPATVLWVGYSFSQKDIVLHGSELANKVFHGRGSGGGEGVSWDRHNALITLKAGTIYEWDAVQC